MKKVISTLIITALFASGIKLMAQNKQDYLGLPGDNLDLYAVMNLFQQSKTLEDFEKSLNDNNTNINNLDLNSDNQVDYIKVIDNVNGDLHNIVLQVAISPTENQDVAVFTIQRFNNGTVQIQLTGDEDLYGKNYIIEPITDKETPNPGYTGEDVDYVTTPAQISVWPVVRYIYLPTYTGWHSSWYWGYYPTYWQPWHPVSWHYYSGYQSNWDHIYYSHYRLGESHRSTGWHDYYYAGRRAYSPEVNHRIVAGTYKTTYSHPDQRSEGDAMFAKAHPEQYKSVHSSGNSSVHSTGNNNSGNRRDNGSVLTNKNNNSVHPTGNNSAVTRRPTTNVTNKTVVNPTTVKSTETSRRPTSTVTNPSGVNRPTGKVNTSSSRSTVTNKSVTNPSAPQNVRSSTQSKTTTVSSSNRSTKKASKNSTSTKGRNQNPDSRAPDRR
jgi:hypothetical protein